MKLLELIQIASDAYDADGWVMRYHTHPDDEPLTGDGLAHFIAVELAETFDEDASDEQQLETAQDAMLRARDELQSVIYALE